MRRIGIRTNATTWTLVADVVWTVRHTAKKLQWPDAIPKKDAGIIMHSFAAELDYREETGVQRIRAAWVSLEHGYGDCKSTAVLIASMALAANRKVALRFLQYEPNVEHWAHVYAVVDGIACDPLLPYGKEYPYIRALTIPV